MPTQGPAQQGMQAHQGLMAAQMHMSTVQTGTMLAHLQGLVPVPVTAMQLGMGQLVRAFGLLYRPPCRMGARTPSCPKLLQPGNEEHHSPQWMAWMQEGSLFPHLQAVQQQGGTAGQLGTWLEA